MKHSACQGFVGKLSVIALAALGWINPIQAQEFMKFAGGSSTPIVKFTEHFGEMDFSLDPVSIEIYGDGLVVVEYPVFMKKAGLYQLTLEPADLDALLSTLSSNRIPAFDAAAAKADARTAANLQAQSDTLFFSSDPSVTVLELNLESYSPDMATQSPKPVNQRIQWTGLRDHARQYPDLDAIQSLHNAQQALRELMDHPDLIRVEEK